MIFYIIKKKQKLAILSMNWRKAISLRRVSWQLFVPAGATRTEFSQTIEGVNPRIVAVTPGNLDAVTAD